MLIKIKLIENQNAENRISKVGSKKLFLVGAFSLKEKSPTITVSSFFSVDNLTEWSIFYNLFNDQFSEPGERGFDSRTKP